MLWLLIEPHDVLLIRDGKPFTQGESHRANSLFPPTPFTVQGALRALYVSELGNWDRYRSNQDDRINEVIGAPRDKDLGQFQMAGPYLVRQTQRGYERFFPLPADVVQNQRGHLRIASPTDDQVSAEVSNTAHTLQMLDVTADEEALEDSYWISETALVRDYLTGAHLQIDQHDLIPQEDLFVSEHRFGIGMDYERNNVNRDDGLLYAISFVRMQPDTGLLVGLPDNSPLAALFPSPTVSHAVRLGGEGRSARIRKLADNELARVSSPRTPSNPQRYKIILITPTYLDGGWQPTGDQAGHFQQQFVTAVLPRPLAIGGWDLVKDSPRPVRKYLVPGSVFYFERRNGDTAVVDSLLDQPPDSLPLAALGFGEFFTTTWGGQ